MAKAKKPKPVHEEREVQYPEFAVHRFDGENGEPMFTAEDAKMFLGWTPQAEGEDYGDDYFLKTKDGTKVRLVNNPSNRPWTPSHSLGLMHEQLHGRWENNGEPIILTRTGLVASGQHQMIALVWAQDEVTANPKQWKKYHPDGIIRIPKLVVVGISDEDKVINTIDTGKPRSLGDVLFRSPYFATLPPADRKVLAKLAEVAVRVVWERTGAYKGSDAYSPRRTHGEMLDFIARHPKLVEAVEEVWRINEGGKLGQVVRPGMAAGLLYLMAAGKSDQESYAKKRRESAVEFDLWKQAVQYLTFLADDGEQVKQVRTAIGNLADTSTGEGATAAERVAVAVLGWHDWRLHGSVGLASVTIDRDKVRKQAPVCGGIDVGPKTDEDPPEDNDDGDEGDNDPTEVSEEELEAMGADDYQPDGTEEEKLAGGKAKAGPKPEPLPKSKTPKKPKPTEATE